MALNENTPIRDPRRIGKNRQMGVKKKRNPGTTGQTWTIIPITQQLEMKRMWMEGRNITEISEATNRDRTTVAKIVRSKDMQEYVDRLQEELYDSAGDFVATVKNKAKEKSGWELAYRLLKHMGVIQDRLPLPTAQQMMVLSGSKEENEAVQQMMARMARIAYLRSKVYGTKFLPESVDEKELKASEVAEEGSQVDSEGEDE